MKGAGIDMSFNKTGETATTATAASSADTTMTDISKNSAKALGEKDDKTPSGSLDGEEVTEPDIEAMNAIYGKDEHKQKTGLAGGTLAKGRPEEPSQAQLTAEETVESAKRKRDDQTQEESKKSRGGDESASHAESTKLGTKTVEVVD
eukprot:3758306-Amphidinium_carterae.1